MAMPSSGSIGLKYCVGTTACSSIGVAVDGNTTGDKSLSTLSVSAGKSAPHCMREFYGYVNISLSVDPSSAHFFSDGDTCTICVCASAGNSWTVSENETWLSLFHGSGTGNGTFDITASNNFGGERTGTVCVTSSAPQANVIVNQDES